MELEAYYNAHRMLMITQAAYPNVEYRHVIGPKQTHADIFSKLL